jgi:murein DD-endopeptidase MepM/ murein hydrolase activator NlpD
VLFRSLALVGPLLCGGANAQTVSNTQAAPALLAPVSPTCVTSPFGPRVLPGLPKAGTYHYGIDLRAPAGAAVRAVTVGRVLFIRRRGAGGLEVEVQHPGFTALYAHLGMVTPALATGARDLAAGEKLGVIGRSGLTYGTHLYFELQLNGQRIDPAPFLGITRCVNPPVVDR